MTVDFALFLSPEGIALAHRQPAGHWAFIGETSVDVPDLAAALDDLRGTGEARGGPDFPALLILPDDQILYREFEGLGGSADVVARLDGLTPYRVEDLAHDWRDIGGGRAKLAIVARETLAEADSFARSHGFNGVGFAAAPPVEKFPGVPVFEVSEDAELPGFPATGLVFGPDTWAKPGPEAQPDHDEPEAPSPEESAPVGETPPDDDEAGDQSAAEDRSLEEDLARRLAETGPVAPPPTGSLEAPVTTDGEPDTGAPDPVAAPEDAPTGGAVDQDDTESGDDAPLHMPAGFGARRGRAPAPDGEAGRLIGARASRFGAAPAADAPGDGPSLEAPTEADTDRATGLDAPARDDLPVAPRPRAERAPREDAPARAPAMRAESAPGRRPVAAAPARKMAAAKAEPRRAPGDDEIDHDAPIMGGLLAKGQKQRSGPSFRMGLILTLMLLLILALIAVWAALFAPQSELARFLGRQVPDVELAAPAPPRPAPPPTVTAPAAPDREAEVAALPPRPAPTPPAPAPALPEPVSEPVAEATAPALLPDIDADVLELGPAPVDPATRLPTLEETEALYASDGIWQRPPDAPEAVEPEEIDDIYMAAIDPVIEAVDALALPVPDMVAPSERIAPFASPAPFGTRFALGPDGLVLPTPEGALTADGVRIVAGLPPVAPAPRPGDGGEAVADAIEDAALDVANAVLAAFQPVPRPADLVEQRERQILGGFTNSELAAFRPTERPPSVQQVALAVRAAATAASDGRSAEAPAGGTPGATFDPAVLDGSASTAENVAGATALAVASSRLPSTRPGSIAALADRAADEAEADEPQVQTASAPAAAATVQPSIPSNASVSRAATMTNTINLRQLNLIGVSGTQANRRALLRLPSGRFVRVAVGDRIDGGQVAAIGERSLQYVKNGRNIVLEIPG